MNDPMPKVSGEEKRPNRQEAPPEGLLDGDQGPGPVLRRRRESLDLSVKDVALRLGVSSDLIRAVESDSFERFAAPIYARNFLRRYAQLLELPEEPLIAAYERLAKPEPPPLKRVSLREQATVRHRPVRWTTVLLVLALLVLLGVWWWTMSQPPAPSAPETDEDATLVLPPPETP